MTQTPWREVRGGGEPEDVDVVNEQGIQMSRFWSAFALDVYGTWCLCHASCGPDEGVNSDSDSGGNACQGTLDQRVSSSVPMMVPEVP